METRRLGRTGHHSSVAILGGAAFATDSPETAEPFLAAALAAGINHLDIAPGYGLAERAVGPHLPAVRDRLFIADKTGETERDRARERLDKTLTRLQIDQLDLYQAHGVTSIDELDRRAEAFEVILDAREQGLTRQKGLVMRTLDVEIGLKRPKRCATKTKGAHDPLKLNKTERLVNFPLPAPAHTF